MLQDINKDLLIYLNSLLENIYIEKMAILFSDLPIFFLPIFLVFFWIYFSIKNKNNEKKNDLLYIFYSCLIAILINIFIQFFMEIDRPETVLQGVGKLVLHHIPDVSFPSDHTSIGFAFLLSIFLAGYKKTAFFYFFFIFVMSLSRVIIGVHWPFDIIAGILVGVISSMISFKVLKKNKLARKLNLLILKLMSIFKL